MDNYPVKCNGISPDGIDRLPESPGAGPLYHGPALLN